MSTDRINRLKTLLIDAAYKYYNFGTSPLTDSEFDELENELRNLDPQSAYFLQVGADAIDKFPKFTHHIPMLSLDKEYDLNALLRWVDKYGVLISAKIDGLALSIHYEDGILVKAATRGRNDIGNEVTPNVLVIKSIPYRLPEPLTTIVRGEVYFTKNRFEELVEEAILTGAEVPKSSRNYAVGSLKQENPQITKVRGLDFLAYKMIGDPSTNWMKTEHNKFQKLQQLGFVVVDHKLVSNNVRETIEYYQQLIQDNKLPYEADGVVVTLNNTQLQNDLGNTGHHPRYAKAYKWKSETAVTKLLSIEWNTGMSGNIVPLGHIDPVHLSGATISKLKLHNAQFLIDNNIAPDAMIEVVRSGEVIPKFLKTVVKSTQAVPQPSSCPSCGNTQLDVTQGGTFCRSSQCNGMIHNKIQHFVKVLDIEHLGKKTVERLFSSKAIQEPADIYKLSRYELLQVVGDKMATKILNSIKSKRHPSLLLFLTALGIKGMGRGTVDNILNTMSEPTLQNVRKLIIADLLSMPDIGSITAYDIVDGLGESEALIDNLLNAGCIPEDPSTKEVLGNSLEGFTFVITGTLSQERNKIQDMIREHGGKATTTVSSKTTHLVAGENTGASKMSKADQYGTKIITEDELYKMMGIENV